MANPRIDEKSAGANGKRKIDRPESLMKRRSTGTYLCKQEKTGLAGGVLGNAEFMGMWHCDGGKANVSGERS